MQTHEEDTQAVEHRPVAPNAGQTETNRPSPEQLSATGHQLRRFAAGIAIILVVGFIAIFSIKAHDEHELSDDTKETAATAPPVDVVTVAESPSFVAIALPGQTAAWYESVIYARVDGYVASWTANIGDHVTKGQVLATIDTPDLDAQLVASEAKVRAANAAVEFTKSTFERWKDSPAGVVSQQERESKKADYDNAVAQLGLDQADVDRYRSLAAFKQVTAPYDGTITERHIDIGNLVTSGSTSNTTSLYRMVQDDPMRVFVDVPQRSASDIKTDQMATITANSMPDHPFEGKVARTANAINEQTRTLHVEVDLPNPDHTLVSGLYVDVTFQVPSKGLVQVPAAALVFRPSGPNVAVVDKNNKIEFHKVTIARDNGNTVELGSGVSVGDKVALNISSQIAEGEVVEPHDSTEVEQHAAQK